MLYQDTGSDKVRTRHEVEHDRASAHPAPSPAPGSGRPVFAGSWRPAVRRLSWRRPCKGPSRGYAR